MTNNIQLIQTIYETMFRRNEAGVLALMDDEIEIIQTPLLPWGGHYRGKAGVLEFFGKLLGNLDTQLKLEEFYEADENRVIVIGRTHGHVRKNNAPFDVRLVHIWTIRGGKAARFEPYINTPEMLLALG